MNATPTRSRTVALVLLLLPALAPCLAQSNGSAPGHGQAPAGGYTGSYVMNDQGVSLTLVLNQDPQGGLSGTLSSTAGSSFTLEGMVQDGIAVGACYGDSLSVLFEAQLQGNQLLFAMIEPGNEGGAGGEGGQQFLFTRQEAPGGRPAPAALSAPPVQQQQGGPAPHPSPAPPTSAGQTPLSAGEIGDPGWGFKFRAPQGWKHQADMNGALLGHDTVPGMILVLPHQATDLQQMAAQMQQGLVDQGVHLMPAGAVSQRSERVLTVGITGTMQGQRVQGHGIGTLSPHGGGAFILAITTPDQYGQQLAGAADAVAAGMQFVRVDASDLIRHFSGRWASYSGGSGVGTLRNLSFYPNGTFSDGSETSYSTKYSSDGWQADDVSLGATGVNSSRGRWTVRGTRQAGQIVLSWPDGDQSVIEYHVHVERGETYWNEYSFNGSHYSKQEGF